MLALGVVAQPGALAQSDGEGEAVLAEPTPTDVPIDEPSVVAEEPPTIVEEPTATFVDEPTEPVVEETPTPIPTASETAEFAADASPADPAPPDVSPTETPDPTPTEQPEPTPTLRYRTVSQPRCDLVEGAEAAVGHGGFIEYRCSLPVRLNGEHLAPGAVQLDWTVSALAEGAWTVQLSPPPPPDTERQWTEPSAIVELQHQTSLAGDETESPLESFGTDETVVFGLRVHRATCDLDSQPTTVTIGVRPSVPGLDTAQIEATSTPPEPLVILPALAPIPAPSLSFSGSLDFGEVPVDAFGVREEPEPATIVLTVDGLDQTCGAWEVDLEATALGGEDGLELAESGLRLAAINETPLEEGGCPLDGGCTVARIEGGPAAEPTATYTLDVSLALTDLPRAETFQSTLTAAVTEVEADI